MRVKILLETVGAMRSLEKRINETEGLKDVKLSMYGSTLMAVCYLEDVKKVEEVSVPKEDKKSKTKKK